MDKVNCVFNFNFFCIFFGGDFEGWVWSNLQSYFLILVGDFIVVEYEEFYMYCCRVIEIILIKFIQYQICMLFLLEFVFKQDWIVVIFLDSIVFNRFVWF